MPGLIDTAADLVDVSGNAADGGSQFLLLGEIHFDDITVDRHLAQIGSHVFCAKLLHLFLDKLMFLLGDTELNADWSGAIFHHYNSPYVSNFENKKHPRF